MQNIHNSARFTSGPWNASNGGCGPGVFRIYSEEPSVFLCAAFSTDHTGIENVEANARLIAAAPEMYDALDLALATIERLDKKGSAVGTLDVLRAVLAKANGEAQT